MERRAGVQEDEQQQQGPAQAVEGAQEESAASREAPLKPARREPSRLESSGRRELTRSESPRRGPTQAKDSGQAVGLQRQDDPGDGDGKRKELGGGRVEMMIFNANCANGANTAKGPKIFAKFAEFAAFAFKARSLEMAPRVAKRTITYTLTTIEERTARRGLLPACLSMWKSVFF